MVNIHNHCSLHMHSMLTIPMGMGSGLFCSGWCTSISEEPNGIMANIIARNLTSSGKLNPPRPGLTKIPKQ